MICKKMVIVEGLQALLDVGDRRVDLECLGNRDATLRPELVVVQTANVGVE